MVHMLVGETTCCEGVLVQQGSRVIGYSLLEEVGLALQGNHIHEVEWGGCGQNGAGGTGVRQAVRGARTHVMAGWEIVDERVSTHMHTDTVVCVHVCACTLVQQEMVGLVWVGETAPHGQGGVRGRACVLTCTTMEWVGVCRCGSEESVHARTLVRQGGEGHACTQTPRFAVFFVHVLTRLCDSGG